MQDVIVVEQLRKRGMITLPYTELLPYESMERRARILDKAPKQLTLKKVGEISPCGTAQKFCMVYDTLRSQNTLEMGTLDLRGNIKYCDPEVYYVLQTLIRLSIGKCEQLVNDARDLFILIVTSQYDTITKGAMYELISKYNPSSFYAKELINGMYISVYGEQATALYWRGLCEYTGFYSEAIKLGMDVIKANCSNEREVRGFCTVQYKKAKEDEEFLNKIYKKGANKYLIAMLYYLYPTHPEIVDIGMSADEFANLMEKVGDDNTVSE